MKFDKITMDDEYIYVSISNNTYKLKKDNTIESLYKEYNEIIKKQDINKQELLKLKLKIAAYISVVVASIIGIAIASEANIPSFNKLFAVSAGVIFAAYGISNLLETISFSNDTKAEIKELDLVKSLDEEIIESKFRK